MTIKVEHFHGYRAHPKAPKGPGPLMQGSCANCNARAMLFEEIGGVFHDGGDRRRPGVTICTECGDRFEHDFLATDVRTRFIIQK